MLSVNFGTFTREHLEVSTVTQSGNIIKSAAVDREVRNFLPSDAKSVTDGRKPFQVFRFKSEHCQVIRQHHEIFLPTEVVVVVHAALHI